MNLRLPGMGSGPDKPATLGDPESTERNHESTGLMGMPAGSASMDYSAQSMDTGSAVAPHAAAPIIRGVAVLGLLLAIAGTGLFTMRSMGKKGLVEDPDVKIDVGAISEASDSVVTTDHVELLEDLRGAGEFAQVSLDNVQMNPFTMRIVNENQPVSVPLSRQETEEERLAREKAARLAEAQREFDKLKLNSVMAGSVPLAQISGKLVRIGDLVNERFKVNNISGRSVELVAEGQTFVLVIGE